MRGPLDDALRLAAAEQPKGDLKRLLNWADALATSTKRICEMKAKRADEKPAPRPQRRPHRTGRSLERHPEREFQLAVDALSWKKTSVAECNVLEPPMVKPMAS